MKEREKIIRGQMEETARLFYLYSKDYVEELRNIREQWNSLLDIVYGEQLNIDWREILPRQNCEGQIIW